MNSLLNSAAGGRRLGALVALGLIVIVPIIWIAWTLNAASAAAAALATQQPLLAQLQARVGSLELREGAADGIGDGPSVFLPGETLAIAGAALQEAVVQTIGTAGGRVIETEFARVEAAEEDPGRVDLRVSFDAEIISLQQVLFGIETGLPILLVRSIEVQTTGDDLQVESPPLRVVMLVSGYLEAAP